jgi:hypothetical protein
VRINLLSSAVSTRQLLHHAREADSLNKDLQAVPFPATQLAQEAKAIDKPRLQDALKRRRPQERRYSPDEVQVLCICNVYVCMTLCTCL